MAILSVVGSCRRLKIPVPEYRAELLPGLPDLSILFNIAEFLVRINRSNLAAIIVISMQTVAQ